MNRNELIGKKIYYKENKLGEVVELRQDPFGGNNNIAIIETEKNSYKAAPMKYLHNVANRVEFQKDRTLIDGFPLLSNRDIEEERDKYKNALKDHYGDPNNWTAKKEDVDSKKDQSYMGSSQITNQAPEDNKSLKGKVDYDKIKRGEE